MLFFISFVNLLLLLGVSLFFCCCCFFFSRLFAMAVYIVLLLAGNQGRTVIHIFSVYRCLSPVIYIYVQAHSGRCVSALCDIYFIGTISLLLPFLSHIVSIVTTTTNQPEPNYNNATSNMAQITMATVQKSSQRLTQKFKHTKQTHNTHQSRNVYNAFEFRRNANDDDDIIAV